MRMIPQIYGGLFGLLTKQLHAFAIISTFAMRNPVGNESADETYLLDRTLQMLRPTFIKVSERLSRQSRLPAIATDLFLITGRKNELHQLTSARHVVHVKRPVADPYNFSRIVDVDIVKEFACLLVWLQGP